MDLQLKDRTVVVTGASSGVGLATARYLLSEGARVAACARDAGRLSAAFDEFSWADKDSIYLASCDVTDQDATNSFIAGTLNRFGAVDGLVCNAGRSLMATLQDTTDQQLRDEFSLKIFGVLNMVRSARSALNASPHGSVVNVNAILSRQPELRLAATSAARAALLNLTHSLAEDLATEGTRVNSVLLGLVDTGQWRRRFEEADSELDYEAWSAGIAANRGIRLGRFGTAEEVAFHIVSLLSPLSGYTTGATIDVGGGVGRYV
ncbi:SDR family oxidoreductase [Paenarthrobacter aurescens]|jgi:NAD(P)-dependent dehydrogenase (short-subunit alcohol dehydrogenase family)|uniref:Oxidoreductase, short chain dehydrogenase/reductase family n=1 Tax=Paenarthrobacter aurescens (strain TC1) TaxID=290340 RepID=A1R614_PAEAT|nr:SDR family oxidoreductase [Paenarthrobacter aurescens]ABM06465.1 oxidoreductase, short chain dehydrogenase/reductase family [Paenarthrobacter aurescens TC1]